MKKYKLNYEEKLNNLVTNQFNRICQLNEIDENNFIIKFLFENKDFLNLNIKIKDNEISILRDGNISYEVKHVQDVEEEFLVKINTLEGQNSFKQKIKTQKINIQKTKDFLKIFITYKKQKDVIETKYTIYL